MKKYPSPDDIQEMRARGYDVSTIAEAVEQSKRWHLAQAIGSQVREAFFGVKLGGGVGLRQAQGMDGYESEDRISRYRLADEKEDWSRLRVEDLNACESSLCFFDAEGMRFHLPAFLLADLSGDYDHCMAYCLTDLNDLRREQFSLLSVQQRAAVCEYLRFIAEEESYWFQQPDILRALEEYWTK